LLLLLLVLLLVVVLCRRGRAGRLLEVLLQLLHALLLPKGGCTIDATSLGCCFLLLLDCCTLHSRADRLGSACERAVSSSGHAWLLLLLLRLLLASCCC
jgi:hypothetical protein